MMALDKKSMQENYNNMIMEYPLGVEEVWDREMIIRDSLQEEYGLVNFVNRTLMIGEDYLGHYNSIIGESKSMRRLYYVLKKYFKCYYRREGYTASIIFPFNVSCEVYNVLDKIT